MASNRDRAAEVLLEKDSEESFAVATNHDAFLLASEQRRADAQALADAGVLADDLPAPDEGEWVVGRNVISLDGMHILPMIDNDALTPDEARDLALALWAAAAHAEKAAPAQKEENDE